MNPIPTTTLALALLAASLPSQNEPRAQDPRVQRAALIEAQEGDLDAAERAWRALLADLDAQAVHDEAALRLGALLWRLDRRDEAEPLLQRAAKAGEAFAARVAAVRAEQGELAQARRQEAARAEALVARMVELVREMASATDEAAASASRNLTHVQNELRKAPTAAAAAVAAALRRSAAQGGGVSSDELRVRGALAGELWRLGTKAAVDYLTEVATQGDAQWQEFVLEYARHELPAELLPVLRTYTQVNDPTRRVWSAAVGALKRQAPEVMVRWFADEHPGTVEATLTALNTKWRVLALEPWKTAFMRDHAQRLVDIACGDDPDTYFAAWKLLGALGNSSDTSQVKTLLAAVRRMPERVSWERTGAPVADDGELVAALAETASVLGSVPESGPSSDAQTLVLEVLPRLIPHWGRASVPDALTLLGGNYDSGGHRWLPHAYQQGDTDARTQILAHFADLDNGIVELGRTIEICGAQPSMFPTIRDVVGRWPTTPNKSGVARTLLMLAARTGHPDAAGWLSDQIDQYAVHKETLARALIACSRLGAGEHAWRGLRRLLVHVGEADLDRNTRGGIFAELTRVGDRRAIPSFSAAWSLGVHGNHNVSLLTNLLPGETDAFSELRSSPMDRLAPRVRSLLDLLSDDADLHGFDRAGLAAAWRELLTGEASDQLWDYVRSVSTDLPRCALPSFAKAADARFAAGEPGSNIALRINRALQTTSPDVFDAEPDVAAAIRKLLAIDAPDFAAACFASLHRDTAERLADVAVQKLRTTRASAWLTALTRQGLPVTADDWRAALTGDDVQGVLAMLPPDAPVALRADLEGLLSARSAVVRIEAVNALARVFGGAAAAALLPMLQDSEDQVRAAAREQLDRLRDAQEHRRFWARVQGGVDMTPEATSQKLVQQAMPDQPAAQRVLAMRSLAAVGATEALPLLIEWSKEDDAAVREAANAAIQTILTRAESGG